MNDPSVTIIVPTFNWSSVLPFSVGSALRQTFTDFELLVIGDGCTDDSAAVVGALGDERVRWINLATHVGHQSGPNNEGLRQARGGCVAYSGTMTSGFRTTSNASCARLRAERIWRLG